MFQKKKKFIVLEDDLIVSDELLFFCNKALTLYNNKKINILIAGFLKI